MNQGFTLFLDMSMGADTGEIGPPAPTDSYLLEDGSGVYAEEISGVYLQET